MPDPALELALLELAALADAAEAYMAYHRERFYDAGTTPPTGLTPAIERARTVIRALTPPPEVK